MKLQNIANTAYKERTTADIILETMLFLATFAIPYTVLSQLIGGLAGAPNKTLVVFFSLVSILIMLAALYLGNMHLDAPLPFFAPLYLTQTVFFVCFFIIFASKESFRLPQQTLFAISVSFAFVVFLAQSALRGSIIWRRNYLNLPIGLILAWALFSFAFSTSFFISLQDYFVVFFIVLLFWLVINTFDYKKHFTYLGTVAIVIGALMSAIGVAQHFNFTEIYGLERNMDTFSTLGNKNYVAELLAMLLPFSLAMITATGCFWRKLALWAAVECMLIVVLVSQTRGSWLGLGLGLSVLVLYGMDNFDRKRAISLLGTVGGFILNAVLLMYLSQKQFIFYKGPTAYEDRFLSIIREVNSMLSKSPQMWLALAVGMLAMIGVSQVIFRTRRARLAAVIFIAVSAAGTLGLVKVVRQQIAENPQIKSSSDIDLNKPLAGNVVLDDSIASRRFIYGGSMQVVKHYPLGTGIGAFKTKYLSMLKEYLKEKNIKTIPGFFKDVNAKEAHNEYLHTLAEEGPVGLLLLLFFVVRLVLYFYRVYYRKADDYTRMIVLGAFSGLAAIGGSAMLGFPFRIVPTAVVSGLLLATIVFGEDRAAEAETALAGAAPGPAPDADPRRRHFYQIDPALGVTLVLLVGIPFFLTCSVFAYRWQASNIVLKNGDALSKVRRFDEALAMFNRARDEDPSNGEIYFSLGMLYQGLADTQPEKREENLDKAVDYFLKSLHYYELPMARLNLGAAYFQKGEIYLQKSRYVPSDKSLTVKWKDYFARARKEFDETISLYPNYSLPWFNLGLIDYENAMNAMDSGKNEEASKLLQSAEKLLARTLFIDPGLVSASFKQSLVYEKMGRKDSAISQYEKTTLLTPVGPGDPETLADSFYNLGILYYNKAIELFNQANAPGVSEEKRAAARKESVDFNAKSQKMFYRTIEMNPNHIKALNNLGNILYQEGKVEEAMQNYKRALDIDPSYFEPKINMPLIYLGKGLFDDALRYAEDLLKTPGLSGDRELKVLRILGICNLRLNNLPAANKALTTVIEKFKNTEFAQMPEYGLALSDLAETRQRMNDPSAADLLKLAVGKPMNPIDHLRALNRLAVMQLNSGGLAPAQATLKNAMDMYAGKYNDSIDYANIIYNYAVVLFKQNRQAEAKKALESFLSKPISNPEVKAKINELIKRLGPSIKTISMPVSGLSPGARKAISDAAAGQGNPAAAAAVAPVASSQP